METRFGGSSPDIGHRPLGEHLGHGREPENLLRVLRNLSSKMFKAPHGCSYDENPEEAAFKYGFIPSRECEIEIRRCFLSPPPQRFSSAAHLQERRKRSTL